MLRVLERDGLIVVEQSPGDGRVRAARLTDTGRREVATLDSRSDDAAIAILQPLNDSQRDRLVAAMTRGRSAADRLDRRGPRVPS